LDYVCSFGANLLHLGNVGKQVSRRFLGLQLFHVKHTRDESWKKNILHNLGGCSKSLIAKG
jgi:hypothetical protein